jgi:hypothetical protein
MTIRKGYVDHGLVDHDKSNDIAQVSIFRDVEAVEWRREGKTGQFIRCHLTTQPSSNGQKLSRNEYFFWRFNT